MQNSFKELTPVNYGPSAVKALNLSVKKNDTCFRLHWHERMELIRLKRGKMQIGYAENSITLNENEIYIIPPKTPHIAVAFTDVEYDVIMFDVRSFYNDTPLCHSFLVPIFEGGASFTTKTDNKEILACFDKILALNDKISLEITSLIYRILDLLLKHALTDFSQQKNDTVIDSAVKYIEENFESNINNQMLAKQFGYSCEHFCRKFKNETHLTPMNYLKIYRLEAAARLLKSGKYNVREIALKCGFDDSNYFTRCFKSHFGIPPTKYSG